MIMILLSNSGIVYASQIGTDAIDTRPEAVCLTHGDKPEMKDLCAWIDICDDTGEFNSNHGFCTGYVVRNPPGPGGCPSSFHSTDDDESGLCYENMGPSGCEYEDLIIRPGNRSCGTVLDVCKQYPDLTACSVTINLGTPENRDYNCDRSVPDHCFSRYEASGFMFNGTAIEGNRLTCNEVNVTDFRVTVNDWSGHRFDKDFDGIGCEKAYQDIQDIQDIIFQ
jgi:hypothetical protein